MKFSHRIQQVKPSMTLAIDAKAKELKAQGQDVIGFGAGEPDFNTPELIKQAGVDAIEQNDTHYTPVSGTNDLKDAINKTITFTHPTKDKVYKLNDKIIIILRSKNLTKTPFT